MAGKKEREVAAKQRHKESLLAAKRRRKEEPQLKRAASTLTEREIFLIVCEGANTEPSYFRKFKLSNATIEVVGRGYNTLALVNQARRLSTRRKYDQVWCVLDADPMPGNPNQTNNFNTAVQQAEALGFHVAYSNQAFEYWLILHFNDHQGNQLDRQLYDRMLNDHLGEFRVGYDGEGSKMVTQALFDLLWEETPEPSGLYRSRTDRAIARARRNHGRFEDGRPPAQCESTTTVFQLVEVLKAYM